jgi:hypothetical protein
MNGMPQMMAQVVPKRMVACNNFIFDYNEILNTSHEMVSLHRYIYPVMARLTSHYGGPDIIPGDVK